MADLTYGDVFKLFPRMNNVTTPELNRRIIIPRHLRPVTAADRFRELYKEGRRLVKSKPWENGEKVDIREKPFPLERLLDDAPSVEELQARIQVGHIHIHLHVYTEIYAIQKYSVYRNTVYIEIHLFFSTEQFIS